MTLRHAPILAAVCTLGLYSLTAPVVRADTPLPSAAPSAQTPVDSEASQAAPTASPYSTPYSASAATRYYHRRVAHHSYPDAYSRAYLRVPSLPSRGIAEPVQAADTAVGRLAVVTADKAAIVAGRDRAGRVLSVCPKGQYLAISGETPTQYAVLMIDHSIGYIAKSDVQLLDYQVDSGASSGGVASDNSGASALEQRMVDVARTYLGVPYVWGGDTKAGIDCSGFVQAIYAACGIPLPRVSRDQAAIGYDVPHDVAAGDWTQWVPGDRLYFACHHPFIDHTAMYIGDGYFIHASAGHDHQVAIDRVDNPYYSSHLVAVRRSAQLLAGPPANANASQTASNDTSDSESDQQ